MHQTNPPILKCANESLQLEYMGFKSYVHTSCLDLEDKIFRSE